MRLPDLFILVHREQAASEIRMSQWAPVQSGDGDGDRDRGRIRLFKTGN